MKGIKGGLVLSTVFSVFGTLGMFAQPRSISAAKQVAEGFQASSLELKAKASDFVKHVPYGDAFYVFAPQETSGFVIVSSDEQMPSVLGYSTTSVFDKNHLPDGLKALLETYQREWEYVQSLTEEQRLARALQAQTGNSLPVLSEGVSPILKTQWNQLNPYNNLCPYDGEEQCPTGCVATAMAQVLKHIEYPVSGTGSVAYTIEGVNQQIDVEFDFTNTVFDWSAMRDTYNGEENEEEKNAVATLMAALGAASEMRYCPSGSATSLYHMSLGLTTYLGIDPDMCIVSQDNIDEVTWQSMLLSELNAGYPVVTAGQSTVSGGHAFVIDGYLCDDATNPSYHVNWGWGGYCDGYFKITSLDPMSDNAGFDNHKELLCGARPDNGIKDRAGFLMGKSFSVELDTIWKGIDTQFKVSIDGILNSCPRSFAGYFDACLVDGEKEILLGSSCSINDLPFFYRIQWLDITCSLPDSVAPGTYELAIRCHSLDSNLTDRCYFFEHNPQVVVAQPEIYKLTYSVDGSVYHTESHFEGDVITPLQYPTKEGYTFSGWSEIPDIMPAHDVEVTGTFTINSYMLTYKVDGEVYATETHAYGETITPLEEPTKEGYTFSGWSEIPDIMPAHDVEVTGAFTINNYTLTYKVDGEVYAEEIYAFGDSITPLECPVKEGYTFSGWSEIPDIMPAHDVEVTGTFTVNHYYTLTYVVDDEIYATESYACGDSVTPLEEPVKEGFTFSGWNTIVTMMPAYDVWIWGSFSANVHTITWMIVEEAYLTEDVEYGSSIIEPEVTEREGLTFAWEEHPATMPDTDLVIHGNYTVGIESLMDLHQKYPIFDLNGHPVEILQKGNLYISNGKIFQY